MKIIILSIVISVLIGCATAPISTSQAVPIALEDSAPATLSRASPDKGKIVMIRDPQFAMPCNEHVYLDGTEIAALTERDMITFYLSPGEYDLSAEVGYGTICKTFRTQTILKVPGPGTYIYHVEMNTAGMFIVPDKVAFGMEH